MATFQPEGVVPKPGWLAKYLHWANPRFIESTNDYQGEISFCILQTLNLTSYQALWTLVQHYF